MKTGLKLPVGVALFAVLALAGLIGMFAFSSAQPAEAQAFEILYDENGTGSLGTFTAVDPERDAIVAWSLDGPDAGLFEIEGGVLRFKEPPNFEESGTDNVHSVTVQATDATGKTGMKEVIVKVGNVDEPGMVRLLALQPQSNTLLTAELTNDIDRVVGAPKWQWAKSGAMSGPFTDIRNAISSTYRPLDGDVSQYLRATATYTDEQGPSKTEMAVSAYPVQPVRGQNEAPEFSDDEDTDATTQGIQAERSVAENTPKGEAIGDPFVAQDDDGDVLTYTLWDDDGSSTDGDSANFTIDRATGQILTKEELNREPVAKATYDVTVRATDPAGVPNGASDAGDFAEHSVAIAVQITVTNENEPADLTQGLGTLTMEENAEVATGLSDNSSEYDYNAVDPDLSVSDNSAVTYTWSVRGTDGGEFAISNVGVLTFKASPNYEDPEDSNKDNVYEVTVVAAAGGMTGTKDVKVTVTNVDETGSVALWRLQPKVGVKVTATLTDPDDDVTSLVWEWQRCDDAETSGSCNVIAGITGGSYTPVDEDEDNWLEVKASYNDAATMTNDPLRMITVRWGHAVDPGEDERPTFDPDDPQGGPIRLEVEENTNYPDQVGERAVTAINHDETVLSYSLGGTDEESFDIRPGTGLITVAEGTKLDYETKDTYRVTVMAEDSEGNSAQTDVIITVTNMPEAPEIMLGGVSVSGMDNVMHEENSGREVATYMASADGARFIALSGADAGDFNISSGGMLSFRSDPNYEMPADSDANNIYMVTVNVRYMTWTDSLDVMVMVTNMDDDGMVTVMPTTARAGMELTASLRDEDGGVTGTTWDWWIDDAMDGDFSDQVADALSAMYTPTMAQEGKYLKARALYDDAEGMDKMAASMAIMVMGAEVTRAEVVAAIRAYLAQAANAPTRAEVVALIRTYLAQ